MADDFQLDDETLRLIKHVQATHPQHAGTHEDPFDLRGPACVIVPVDTPLVNAMPRVSYHGDERGEQLAVTIVRTKAKLAEMGGDANAQTFGECVYALKFAEQAWIARALSAWARAHGVADDAIWNSAYLADIKPDDIQRLTKMMDIGLIQDYVGTLEDKGDACQFTVSVCLVALIHEPVAA